MAFLKIYQNPDINRSFSDIRSGELSEATEVVSIEIVVRDFSHMQEIERKLRDVFAVDCTYEITGY